MFSRTPPRVIGSLVALVALCVLAGGPLAAASAAAKPEKKAAKKAEGGEKKAEKKPEPTFLTPEEAGPDWLVQGEYVGKAGDDRIGVQVIALGDRCFQAVFYGGGLPGDGWDGQTKICLDGKGQGDKTVFEAAKAAKKYMAGPPAEFSAVRTPPAEQPNWEAVIVGERMNGRTDKGAKLVAERIIRKSPTLEAKPPAGAVVLFDGTSADGWNNGHMDDRKLLAAGTKSKQAFGDFTLHLEFMTPFKPTARSQGRGNSGLYLQDRYEVQVLDSFGLEGLDNECGGIYKKGNPRANMCFPPLTWQTYDVEFTAARYDEGGNKTRVASATIRHNGVVIHENLEIDGATGGGQKEGPTPGPLQLQGHGNPVFFRNIWVVERK